MTSNSGICRLCFDAQEKHIHIVNKNIQVMLQTVLINIDISSSEHSGICTPCQGKLENCYYFKKKCRFTEDTLGPFITENVKINLNEIPIQINKSEDAEKDKNVCRLCLQYSDDDTILNKDEQEQFRAFFPEINLNLTNFVVLCSTCYDTLQKYFVFVSLYSRNEYSLYKCSVDCDSKQSNNLEDCREFLRSAEETDEKKVVLLNEEVQIKSEKEEEHLCNSSMDCSTEQIIDIKSEETVSCSTNTDHDDKKLILHEELDIKPDKDSSEKEFLNANLGKGNSNFKIQLHKVNLEHRGIFNDLKELIGSATNSRTFPEEDCNSQQRNTILTKHTSPPKTQIQKCDKCEYETTLRQELKNHTLLHHSNPSKTPKCDKCGNKFKCQDRLKRHLLTKHSDGSEIQMFRCEECDFKTKNKNSLKKHLLYSFKCKEYKCDKCDYKCKWHGNLKCHILINHPDPSKIQVYTCEECDYKTTVKRDLENHVLCRHTVSSKRQTYKCGKCEYKIKSHGGSRILMHKCEECKTKKYKCDKCDYKSKYKANLKSHILHLHTDSSKNIKYNCLKCDFKTKYKTSLNRHMLSVHTGSSTSSK